MKKETEPQTARIAKSEPREYPNTEKRSALLLTSHFILPQRAGEAPMKNIHFRFEDLDIWHLACDLAVEFHKVADRLEGKKLYRYAEQLRAAGLSVSNNIAEGSGSSHSKEFRQFLNIARRSAFECASMLHVLNRLDVLSGKETSHLLDRCDEVSRKIFNYIKSIKQER